MIKQVIRLVRPGCFLPSFEIEKPQSDKVLVRPTVMSICAADQRYFMGKRPKDVLEEKLPMALIHEAIGTVIHDPTGNYQTGQHVILLPGGEEHGESQSNYRKDAYFRSSNADGFCQEMLYCSPEELLAIPEGETECYVFTELMSVCCHAIRRVQSVGGMGPRKRIGIWGDGPMGYMMALAVHGLCPENPVTVFGRHDEKLMLFSFVERQVNVLYSTNLPETDTAFECVGGEGSTLAIEQIISAIQPCGTVALMGVSEVPPAISTRRVLEKGLLLLGSSRSQRQDFEMARKLIGRPEIYGSLGKIVSERIAVNSYETLHEAFMADIRNPFRTVMHVGI